MTGKSRRVNETEEHFHSQIAATVRTTRLKTQYVQEISVKEITEQLYAVYRQPWSVFLMKSFLTRQSDFSSYTYNTNVA